MEHLVEFNKGYDCIKFECMFDSKRCIPKSGGSHGLHGLGIKFVVKGKEGAVHFILNTGWLPQYAEKDTIGCRFIRSWGVGFDCMPTDLGYHSKVPQYEGQEVAQESCPYCDGEPCFYDGSGLNSMNAMYALVNGGDKALWKFLEQYYQFTFFKGIYPEPAEYPMPLRKE